MRRQPPKAEQPFRVFRGAKSLDQMRQYVHDEHANTGKRPTHRRPFLVTRENQGDLKIWDFLEGEGKLPAEANHILVSAPINDKATTLKIALLDHTPGRTGRTKLLRMLKVQKWWQA